MRRGIRVTLVSLGEIPTAAQTEWMEGLSGLDFRPTALHSLSDLEVYLKSHPDGIVILDMDTVATDNRFFRELKRQAPGLYLLALSSRSYHPGLEEAIGSHIYACLAKPLDPEEFRYWMKSIAENVAARQRPEP